MLRGCLWALGPGLYRAFSEDVHPTAGTAAQSVFSHGIGVRHHHSSAALRGRRNNPSQRQRQGNHHHLLYLVCLVGYYVLRAWYSLLLESLLVGLQMGRAFDHCCRQLGVAFVVLVPIDDRNGHVD